MEPTVEILRGKGQAKKLERMRQKQTLSLVLVLVI